MSKSMMGSAGGGKVTVEGLDAEALLIGSAVQVLQGTKVVVGAEGKLDVLAFGGNTNEYNAFRYWDGSKYALGTGNANNTIVGTVKYAIVWNVNSGASILGLSVSAGEIKTAFGPVPSNVVRYPLSSRFYLAVLGTKQ